MRGVRHKKKIHTSPVDKKYLPVLEVVFFMPAGIVVVVTLDVVVVGDAVVVAV